MMPLVEDDFHKTVTMELLIYNCENVPRIDSDRPIAVHRQDPCGQRAGGSGG
jgi:hypothetical protein